MTQKQVQRQPTEEEKEKLFQKILKDAVQSGYFLNPDKDYTLFLMNGLLVNENRYGYQGCPCRLSTGDPVKDLDIVCPCDYRDPDLNDYGMCYCSLYVSQEIAEGRKQTSSIPERRNALPKAVPDMEPAKVAFPVWRCKVCGYLCARENPPELCPICKAKKERFERFM